MKVNIAREAIRAVAVVAASVVYLGRGGEPTREQSHGSVKMLAREFEEFMLREPQT